MEIPDLAQRSQALDIQNSYIVQAPAGSGKTELLTQRYLCLLGEAVQSPEEIIAITFTKKAAREMRERIYKSLTLAALQPCPTQAHAKTTWTLARKVIDRDETFRWNLLANPNQLRIMTIDAFCTSITKQMPILSQLGAQPTITDTPRDYYQNSIAALLEHLELQTPWSEPISTLLLHLDNDYNKVERLLTQMLARRDQWLPHMNGSKPHVREHLEQALQNVITDHLTELQQLMLAVDQNQLLELINFSAHQLHVQQISTPLQACLNLKTLPGIKAQDLSQWLGIAFLLLTKSGEWRKRITVNEGFPPGALHQKMKAYFFDFIAKLQDDSRLRLLLDGLNALPPGQYTSQQWEMITALASVLPLLVAELNIIFSQTGKVDFTQITSAALTALGANENPTDLALKLDYKIQHILVDEFQDTSFTQFQLLEKLTLGWHPEDGRTLFLVGDPMQSIYRFRQAEVGLFIKAQQQGLGTVQLKSLILQANFRSNASLVHWFNHTFSQIFPKISDISLGAVNYQPSVAIREDSPNAFTLHPIYENSSSYSQAEKIVEIIQAAKQENPEQVIAILVKARTHLLDIIPALQQAQLPFHAVEIDALLARPLIQDLLSLTRALLHLADRVAWLSILRAPWCGLDLYDLHAIAGTQHPEIIWKNLKNYAEINKLSSDGKLRLSRIVPVLNAALNERRRISIRDWVEGTWIKLGGLCCIKDPSSLADKDAFFELLEEQQQGGDIRNLSAFSEKLTQLFANPDVNSDGKLQIMTIHKAKGLEFDTVIIPGLERTSSTDNLPLLAWLERTRLSQSSDLILAPIEACNDDKDKIYTYIKQQISEKSFFETVRLLYVAATRAKKSLHMLATLKIVPEKGILQKPRTRSFLHHLWPVVESNFQQLINLHSSRSQAIEAAHSDDHIHLPLNRLPVHGCHEHNFTTSPSVTEISFHNKKTTLYTLNETSKYIGIVAHRFLKHWIESRITILDAQKILNSTIIFETALKRLGTPLSQVDFATHQVKTALQNTLSDPKGQWLLGSHYLDSQCEYPLTQRIDDNVFQYIIDRTFVDENNLRWIIDYKTSSPYNESLSDFLANQKKLYLDQLARYAKTFKSLESRPIKLGLYFPLCHGWIEWDG